MKKSTKQFTVEQRLEIVRRYQDCIESNPNITYKEMAGKIGLAETQFSALRRSDWWKPMLEEENKKRFSGTPINTEVILDRISNDIASLRKDGTKPSLEELKDFIFEGAK